MMKKLILGALALSVLATPALAQDRRDGYGYRPVVQQRTVIVDQRHGPTKIVKREVYRGWRRGERFDYRRAPNYRVINDYRAYRLKAPPRGYRYVRSGNDAVLVGISSGIIATIIAGAIH